MESTPTRLAPLAPDSLEGGRFAPEAVRYPALDRLLVAKRWQAAALVGGSLVVTFILDIVTPVEMSFSLLYLVPVAFATWMVGRRLGSAVAAVCSILVYLWERYGAFPYSSTFFLNWAFVVHFGFYFAFAWALAALRATYLRTKIDTLRDAETGLYNRKAFYEVIAVETRRAIRFSRSLSLATFELAEATPPEDVRKVAGALSASRLYDVAARIERGRFVLLLPETGAEAARITVDRVRHAAGIDDRAGAYVGIATFEWPPTCVDDLLREADRVMAAARKLPMSSVRHAVLRGAAATPVPSGRLSQKPVL
jgi:GGDEF domain-containing protein